MADQLQRASTSIQLNVAEGAGEFSKNEKARFYRIAKRSATESAAILDVCRRLKLVSEASYAAGRDLLLRIVSMLVAMVRDGTPDRARAQARAGARRRKQPLSPEIPQLRKNCTQLSLKARSPGRPPWDQGLFRDTGDPAAEPA